MADVNGGAVDGVIQEFASDPNPNAGLKVDGYAAPVQPPSQPRIVPVEDD